ncbi:hypothetical protein [Methyloprofundus sp.]|uniref:hypothetical protein n=1 Tax=Methyloprofundus sp. TaxID=2020875 RepID=UPI003D14DC98
MEQSNNKDKIVAEATEPYIQEQHSDKQMLINVALKFLLLFTIIFTFDFLVDLVFFLLDLIFEIIHLIIEVIEELLESIMAEALPTDKHQNEAIIVNLAMLIVIFGLYKLFHGFRFVYHLKRHIRADWLKYKRSKTSCWQGLSLLSKIKLVSAYCTGFTLVFFLAF